MDASIVLVGAVALAGTALLVGLIIWLVRSGADEAIAERDTKALLKGKEKRRAGTKIMEENVADESAWLTRARRLVGLPDRSDKP